MAYILIDGYNLIGIAHKNLEKARSDIIEKLSKYSSLKGHNVTIVFDGWREGQKTETRTRAGGVNIIYSRLGEKADTLIKKILSERLRPWIVVSSDREISDFANRKDFVSVNVEEFEDKLNSAIYAPGAEVIEESFEYDIGLVSTRRKGNPRKPSKKQKKKLRTLQKL